MRMVTQAIGEPSIQFTGGRQRKLAVGPADDGAAADRICCERRQGGTEDGSAGGCGL